MTLSAGEVFAGYTIVRLLGAGAMGEVYLAQHPRLPRREAIKVLQPGISADETFRLRFIREADSIADLEHPHIVTVHDRGDTGDRLWIATQFVDGADAARLLRDGHDEGMSISEVDAITTSIADALDYAHGRGLLHRDVKPANILLTDPDDDGNRRVYLADFGIARPVDDSAGLTATNFTFGTFGYAAPEQLMGKAIDGRSDQYALAATAYHLLTGRPVYSDPSPVAVISQHLVEPPPAPSTIRADLASFDTAFARALAKKPEDRFDRCKDFARAITAAATHQSASASAPTQNAPAARAVDIAVQRGLTAPKLTVLTAAALLGLVAIGVVIWHPWTTKDEAPTSSPVSVTATADSSTTIGSSTPPSLSPPSTPAPPPQTSITPARPTYPPAGALGSACPPPGGATGIGPDGAIYYCSRMEYTDSYEWSLTPEDIPNPNAPPPYTPAPASEVNAAGPAPMDPCTVPGAVVPGTLGLMECNQLFGRWVWGVAPR
jgi:serine/threonine protein kinase, bacterial